MSIHALLKCRPFFYDPCDTYTHVYIKIVQSFHAESHKFMTLANRTPLLEVGGTVPVVAGVDWRTVTTHDMEDILATLASGVGLVLIHSGADSAGVIAAIRTSGQPAAAVPIAILGGTQASGSPDAQPDLHIADRMADDIPAILASWRPVPLPETYGRLKATFGADTVRDMALRLCIVLAEALDALDTPAAADTAHKVAGVAGTLGFAELGQQWLAVSHDPAAEPAGLRRDTRRTIAAIVLDTAAET